LVSCFHNITIGSFLQLLLSNVND